MIEGDLKEIVSAIIEKLTYQQRLDVLRITKENHTKEKQQEIGSMDYDFKHYVKVLNNNGLL